MKYLVLIALCSLAACGGEKTSFSTLESARLQAIDNAQINANTWRNAYAPDLVVVMRGDSSITSDCPQGDGWASIDLTNKASVNTKEVELKCSTVSAAIGCMTKGDFQARKDYASQDGSCNSELPFPLPKIGK